MIDKLILAVDEEQDVLRTIQEQLSNCPGVMVHTAQTFNHAREHLVSWTYDLVVLGSMGARGLELLERAMYRKYPVVMLTAHDLNPDAIKKAIELGARAYLPKDQLSSLVAFLEDVMGLGYRPGWKKVPDQVAALFTRRTWRTRLANATGNLV